MILRQPQRIAAQDVHADPVIDHLREQLRFAGDVLQAVDLILVLDEVAERAGAPAAAVGRFQERAVLFAGRPVELGVVVH